MNSDKLPAQVGRREDIRFVTGQGRYTADIAPHDALHARRDRAPAILCRRLPPLCLPPARLRGREAAGPSVLRFTLRRLDYEVRRKLDGAEPPMLQSLETPRQADWARPDDGSGDL